MDRIEVVKAESKKQAAKEAFSHRPVFEMEKDRIGEIRIKGNTTGGWHHHAKRTMYGYVVSGKAEIEFGKDGKERAVLTAGDFFLIPPGLVHRDVNSDQDEAHILIFNIGEGLTSVEVSGPDNVT
jgi:quercetin dioxygenase-like cupin family protein